MSALWEPDNPRFGNGRTVAKWDTAGLLGRGTEQTFESDCRLRRSEAKMSGAPGGQTRGTASPSAATTQEGDTMSVYQPANAGNASLPEPIRYPLAAIPTTYRSCRFRSRLEARWAVFFDHLGIGWTYEPQGFVIGGRTYLPDFLLESGTWVEVKGHEDALDYGLLRTAAIALPQMPAAGERGPKLLVLGAHPIPYDTPMRGDYGWLGLDPDGRGGELLFGTYGFGNWQKHRRPWWLGERTGDGPWLRPVYEEWETDTSGAYAAANGARFEHGESGAR